MRNRLSGNPERPRLTVLRTHKHIYCQLIDDREGKTLVSAGTQSQGDSGGNKQGAQLVGKLIAERALAAGIKQVCFDRGRYKYHGRVAALADSAREAGLQI